MIDRAIARFRGYQCKDMQRPRGGGPPDKDVNIAQL